MKSAHLVVLILAGCLQLPLADPARAMGLNPTGEGGFCSTVCEVNSGKLIEYTTSLSRYSLQGHCWYVPGNPEIATCPPGGYDVALETKWQITGVATESVTNPHSMVMSTKSDCASNPWTESDPHCQKLIEKTELPAVYTYYWLNSGHCPPAYQGPYPIFAPLLTPQVRMSLKSQEAAKDPVPRKPQFIKPQQSQTFIFGQTVDLSCFVERLYPAVLEFEWRSHTPQSGEWPDNFQKVEGVNIANLNVTGANAPGVLGVLTAKVVLPKAGEWKIRILQQASAERGNWLVLDERVIVILNKIKPMVPRIIPRIHP